MKGGDAMQRPDELPLVLKPAEAAKVLRMSRDKVYELIRQNKIPYLRDGRTIRIPTGALLRQLNGEEVV